MSETSSKPKLVREDIMWSTEPLPHGEGNSDKVYILNVMETKYRVRDKETNEVVTETILSLMIFWGPRFQEYLTCRNARTVRLRDNDWFTRLSFDREIEKLKRKKTNKGYKEAPDDLEIPGYTKGDVRIERSNEVTSWNVQHHGGNLEDGKVDTISESNII